MKTNHITALILAVAATAACGYEAIENPTRTDELPKIFPDYIGTTVPLNICPLDFDMKWNNYEIIDVTLQGSQGEAIHCQNDGAIEIPIKKWRALLRQNAGDSIMVAVTVKNEGRWTAYKPFPIYVSNDSIDYGVVYRLIAPAYETFSNIGIYERDLSTFDEYTILDDNSIPLSCMNCHCFNQNNPDDLVLHVRGPKGGTFMRQNGVTQNYITKTDSTINNFAYTYWHPQGRYFVASTNTTRQLFHSGTDDRIDVFDGASDICVFDTETDQILYAPHLRTRDFENWPTFSSDGRKIYFTLADSVPMPQRHTDLRCIICSVDFDAENGIVGTKIDTLVDMRGEGLSASVPRPSYDGKYLMYSSLTFGNFPVWHNASDLWLYDIATKKYYRLDEANSPTCEAYHCWSTNSKWFCVVSRREDNLYSRLYFGRIGDDGRSSRPFLLPQRNPKEYYERCLQSFNCPELTIKPVNFSKFTAEILHNSPVRKRVTMQERPAVAAETDSVGVKECGLE